MPLRTKCTTCARELALDPAFLGASCRCYHCRSLVQVPGNAVASALRVRPAFPALAVAGAAVLHPTSISTSPPASTFATRIALSTTKAWVIAGTATFVVIAGGLTTWMYNLRQVPPVPIVVAPPAPAISEPVDEESGVFDPATAIRKADPRKSYFGIPLEGNTIGFVVDDDQTMAPHIDRLATITNGMLACLAPQNRRVGVVRPISAESNMIVEAAQPSADLEGARSALVARLPSGTTDLIRGLAKTQTWYADQLFLVISKALSDEELAILTQTAEQTGAVTHVIALGAAAKQHELTSLAEATRGQFIPVSDELLSELAEKYANLDPVQP